MSLAVKVVVVVELASIMPARPSRYAQLEARIPQPVARLIVCFLWHRFAVGKQNASDDLYVCNMSANDVGDVCIVDDGDYGIMFRMSTVIYIRAIFNTLLPSIAICKIVWVWIPVLK